MALEDEDVVELALSAIGPRLDGKAAAAAVARRKRAVFCNVLDKRPTACGVSLWLNAGVPAPTVDVLLRVYANCIDGDDEIANQRITGALR